MLFVIQGFWLVLAFILVVALGKYLSLVLKNIFNKFSYAVVGLSDLVHAWITLFVLLRKSVYK